MRLFRHGRAVWLAFGGPFLLLFAAGCDALFGLDAVSPDDEQPNAYVCGCTCFPGTRDEIGRSFEVCAPPALNPNLDGGVAPSPTQIATDCNTRVRDVYVGILGQCASNTVQKGIEDDPGACTCSPTFTPSFVNACNGPCQSVGLATDCSNAGTATSVGALAVCIAAAGQQSMGRVLYGERSTCDVSGTLSVARGDDDPETDPVSGVFEFAGAPCPGASCSVDAFYRLRDSGSLSFESYAGFAGVSFYGIRISGETASPVLIDAAGDGQAAASGLSSSGRGTREEELVFGTISDTETSSYIATNVEPVDVDVAWASRQCAVIGSLINAEVEGAQTDIVVDVLGTIVNQPPRANGGPDRSVECTSASGATVVLSAAASTDPDNDIRFRQWWLGTPGPSPIADPEADGVVSVAQALDAVTTYSLTVVDSYTAISLDPVQIAVLDTIAPSISAVSASPARLRPRNHAMVPITIAVTASDTCGASSCLISSVSSNQPINDIADGNTEPYDWEITGPLTLDARAEASGGVDRVYTVEVTCADTSDNEAVATVDVTVVARR